MHEFFLTRLAQHPVFRHDHNFHVFLEYDQDLAVRSKNKKEVFEVLIIYYILYFFFFIIFFIFSFVIHYFVFN